MDNLLWQMHRSWKRLSIYGKSYPMFTLGGYPNKNSHFMKAQIDKPICKTYDFLTYQD